MSKSRLSSGKIKKLSGGNLTADRYEYLDASQAEPDLGLPSVEGALLFGNTSSGVRVWSETITINTVTGQLLILENTESTSTTTGALVISGGVGISGDVYIGQNLNVGGTAYLNNAEILTTSSGFSNVLACPNIFLKL